MVEDADKSFLDSMIKEEDESELEEEEHQQTKRYNLNKKYLQKHFSFQFDDSVIFIHSKALN